MEIIEADKVFSKVEFHETIDYNIYPHSIYECPACKNQLSFNMKDFKKYSLNKKSLFLAEEQQKITHFLKNTKQEEPNSFLDFHCPQCNSFTRIYFSIGYEEKSSFVCILEFIIIDKGDCVSR